MSDTLNFRIDGLHCGACQRRAQKAIAATPGVAAAEVSLEAKSASVTLGPGAEPATTTAAIIAAVRAAGYEASSA